MDKIIITSLIRRWDDKVPVSIGSVLGQTYNNWEYYILASPTSAPLIQSFLDARGASSVHIIVEDAKDFVEGIYYLTRKCVELAPRGDFFTNLDGDDTLEPNFLEVQLKAIKETHSDIACGGMCRHLLDTGEVNRSKILSKQVILERKDYGTYYPKYFNCVTTLWGKLYRSSLFTADVFQSLPPFESFGGNGHDTLSALILVEKSRRMVLTAGIGYHYYVWEGSLANCYAPNLERSPLLLYERIRDFFLRMDGTITEENQRFLHWIYGDRQAHALKLLFETNRPLNVKFDILYGLLTNDVAKKVNKKVDETYDIVNKLCFDACFEVYQEVQESRDIANPSPTVCKFYELFTLLWPQKSSVSLEKFQQIAFIEQDIHRLKEGKTLSKEEELEALLAEMGETMEKTMEAERR